VGSDFREGNASPQSGLVELIEQYKRNYSQEIKIIRSDSAGWQKQIVDYYNENNLGFTISADQTTLVLEAVLSIAEEDWSDTVARDGIKEGYQIAQTRYCFGSKKREVRLVVKRKLLKKQIDLFSNYRYWIVATYLKEEEYDNYQIIKLHQGRGSMEKKIGELKHQINLNHLPMGIQLVAIIKTYWAAKRISQQDSKNIMLPITKTCREISITRKIDYITNSSSIKKHRTI